MKKKIIKTTVAITMAAVFSFNLSGSSAISDNIENKSLCVWKDGEVKKVVVGGFPFGVKLMCDGVIVIEISDVNSQGKSISPAKEAGLELNDVIISANGQDICSNEELSEIISNSDKSVALKVRRGNETFETNIEPIIDNNGIKRAGMWIRDSAAGIGTVSYIDPQNRTVAGLGHGICDSETNLLMPLERGEICRATITAVTKSSKGNIGGLNGYFNPEIIGELKINDNYGIYAHSISDINYKMLTEVAAASQITTGDATVITTIDGSIPKSYSAVIESIDRTTEKSTKNMIIRITDPELLEKTGGIVQGMSGSPILQNGRFIGAITHVFVNSPEKGYAIFAENMINNYDEYCHKLYFDAA